MEVLERSTLDSLIARSHEIEKKCSDYDVIRANSSNVRMNENAGLTYITKDGEIRNSALTKYSFSQLGTKIGVPSNYLDKCIRSGRISLAQENVNSWLEDYNKDLFIREYDGNIRGVLSSRYTVCDAPDILECVADTIGNKYSVKSSLLNEERLHLRMVSKEMLNVPGEDLFAGLFIDSSDVGRSTLTVQFGIYKQVCTNGLIVSKASGMLYHQVHMGISIDEFYSGLENSVNMLPTLAEESILMIKSAKIRKLMWVIFRD